MVISVLPGGHARCFIETRGVDGRRDVGSRAWRPGRGRPRQPVGGPDVPAGAVELDGLRVDGRLAEHLGALADKRTDEISVVMLTGGLEGFFIAHADLDDLAALAAWGGAVAGDPAVVDPGAVLARVDAAAHGGGDRRSGVGRRL